MFRSEHKRGGHKYPFQMVMQMRIINTMTLTKYLFSDKSFKCEVYLYKNFPYVF